MAEGSGLIKRFYEEVVGGGNLDLIDELATEGMVDHEEGLPGQPSGLEGVRFFVNAMREAIPDIKPKESTPMLADGDLEAARTVLTGTHQGELMGVGATGNTVEFETIDIIRVKDGKCAEHWGVTDVMALMQQIGAVPATA
jgi:predicted ester cyclase